MKKEVQVGGAATTAQPRNKQENPNRAYHELQFEFQFDQSAYFDVGDDLHREEHGVVFILQYS